MKVNIIIIFICLIETLICDVILDKELDPYYVSYETAMHEVKMVSCLNLIEHALKQDGGIKDLTLTMQTTKLNKDKLYTKYIMEMLGKCIKKINKEQIDYLISPENVDNYDLKKEEISNLIQIEGDNIPSLLFTYEQDDLIKEINKNIEKTEKNKKEPGFIEKYIWYILGVIMLFTFILTSSFCKDMLPKKKKEKDLATEELVNFIKEKGKKAQEVREKNKKINEEKEENEKEEKVLKKGKGKKRKKD